MYAGRNVYLDTQLFKIADANVQKVKSYTYNFKKDGKKIDDSVLVYQMEISKKKEYIKIENYYKFEGNSTLTLLYDKNLKKIKETEEIYDTVKVNKSTIIKKTTHIKQYDSYGNLFYSKSQIIRYDGASGINHPEMIKTTIEEFHIDNKGRKTKMYYTNDTHRFLKNEWFYDSAGLLQTMYQYAANANHGILKTSYFYDEHSILVLEIDSLKRSDKTNDYEFYFSKACHYVNSLLQEKTLENKTQKAVYTYDSNGNLIKYCYFSVQLKNCDDFICTYLGKELLFVKTNTLTTYYNYNKDGFLTEERKVDNEGKVYSLSRYFYTY